MGKAAGLRAVPNIWWERRKEPAGTASAGRARGSPARQTPAILRTDTQCKFVFSFFVFFFFFFFPPYSNHTITLLRICVPPSPSSHPGWQRRSRVNPPVPRSRRQQQRSSAEGTGGAGSQPRARVIQSHPTHWGYARRKGIRILNIQSISQ